MPARLLAVVAIVLAMLIAPGSAFASLTGEQDQGRSLAQQLRSGARTCDDVSSADLDHIGEYVMGRVLGSAEAHQAMNDRLRLMMGERAEGRMHQLMGARFAGCGAAGFGSATGPGMMRAASGDGHWSHRWLGADNGRSAWKVAALLLAAALVALLVILALGRRPSRRPPAAAG
jgi:hypothetical protein